MEYPHEITLREEGFQKISDLKAPKGVIGPINLTLNRFNSLKQKAGETPSPEDQKTLLVWSTDISDRILDYLERDLPEATDEDITNQKQKEQMEKDQKEKFDATVAKAVEAQNKKDLATAKALYQEALGINPEATECTDAIAAIDVALVEEATAAQKIIDDAKAETEAADKAKGEKATKDNNFNTLIQTGKDALAASKLADARTAFTEAGKIYPNEAVVGEQLALLEAAEATATQAAAKKTAPKQNAVQNAIEDIGLEW